MIQIKVKIARKTKFWGQLRAKLKTICSQWPSWKRRRTLATKLNEIKGEIEEIWKFNGQLGAKLKKCKTKD